MSILTTCKAIHKEALDVLYDSHAVRGNITQIWDLLLLKAVFRTHVRRVEIDDWLHGYSHSMFVSALLLLQVLPGIRSVIILSDCLSLMHVSHHSFISAHYFARLSGLGEPTCVDIGRYQLCGRLNGVQVVHRKLVDMWPSVVNTPNGYDAVADVLALVEASPLKLKFSNVPIWAAHTSLRRWVGLLDEMTRLFRGTSLLHDKKDEEKTLLARFNASIRCPVRRDHNGNPTAIQRLLLCDLRPGDDPLTLSLATNFLSMNIAAYRSNDTPDGQINYYIAHWAEVDGGMHTFDAMSLHAASALKGECGDYYMIDPLFEKRLFEVHELRLRTGRVFPPSLYQGAVSNLTAAEVRQFLMLEQALDSQGFEATVQQRADDFSSQLLRRYMSATDLLDANEVESASLEDMVKTLAWDYISMFVHAWKMVVREGLEDDSGLHRSCDRILELFEELLELESGE